MEATLSSAEIRVPSPSGEPAIRLADLRKDYDSTRAVRGVSLEIGQGEIFGLIGPDGAGKTSTFQILGGVMEATSGTAEIFGRPARAMRSATGYLTQAFSLYPDLSVDENIRYIGDLRRVPRGEIASRGQRYLRMFDMDRFRGRLAGRLSGGMKQKLALVCALVPEPRVLLLDEPTTGVDPVSRREFWDTLAHLAADGLTILVATPYLDEAERCHRVALIHQGVIRRVGTPRELRSDLNAKRLELRTRDLGRAERLLAGVSGPNQEILDVQRFGDRLDLLAKDPFEGETIIRNTMGREGLSVDEIHIGEPTLENIFVAELRALGQDLSNDPYPAKHPHRDLNGRIA
ncbi:MAG: ABC transporter ATP-binding protein, partial [Bryobacteraceae bacterium]